MSQNHHKIVTLNRSESNKEEALFLKEIEDFIEFVEYKSINKKKLNNIKYVTDENNEIVRAIIMLDIDYDNNFTRTIKNSDTGNILFVIDKDCSFDCSQDYFDTVFTQHIKDYVHAYKYCKNNDRLYQYIFNTMRNKIYDIIGKGYYIKIHELYNSFGSNDNAFIVTLYNRKDV